MTDVTIVNVAMPTIVRTLHATGPNSSSWWPAIPSATRWRCAAADARAPGELAGWVFAYVAGGVALATVFAGVERRIADQGGDPLLNLAVLRALGLVPGLAAVAAARGPAA